MDAADAADEPASQEDLVEPKPSVLPGNRLSTTLLDPVLLRGAATAIVLEGFGWRLKSSAGGIGAVTDDADNVYALSEKRESLDAFLSHSWHASRTLKYLTLLFYFNSWPACTISVVAALVLRSSPWPEWSDEEAARSGEYVEPPWPYCWASAGDRFFVIPWGFVVFVGALLSWHQVERRLGIRRYVFFDKVCIHQSDAQLKEAGIKSIGAFLKSSKLMLVIWDSTYFSRLWCTYELSAFMFTHTDESSGVIRVVPAQLGGVVLAVLVGNSFVSVVGNNEGRFRGTRVLELIFPDKMLSPRWEQAILLTLQLLPFIVVTRWVRKYLRHLMKMDQQLAAFSVHKAECFCCSCHHVHPQTKVDLPCDRELVEEAIWNWFGRGEVDRSEGLKQFDKLITGRFRRQLRRTLGRYSRVPYKFTILVGIPYFFNHLDLRRNSESWKPVIHALHTLFLQWPITFALYVHLVRCGVDKHHSRALDRISFLCLGLLCGICWKGMEMLTDWLLQCHEHYFYPWLLVEGIVIYFLYRTQRTHALEEAMTTAASVTRTLSNSTRNSPFVRPPPLFWVRFSRRLGAVSELELPNSGRSAGAAAAADSAPPRALESPGGDGEAAKDADPAATGTSAALLSPHPAGDRRSAALPLAVPRRERTRETWPSSWGLNF